MTNEATVSGYNLPNATFKGDGKYQISKDVYQNNMIYVINQWEGLRNFAGIVNSNNNNTIATWWDSFSGRTVYLIYDIDCKGNNITIGFYYWVPIGEKTEYLKETLMVKITPFIILFK